MVNRISSIEAGFWEILNLEKPQVPLLSNWLPNKSKFDFAWALHPMKLSDVQIERLIDLLPPQFMEIEQFSFENGYLNLKFTIPFWITKMEAWSSNFETFLEDAKLKQAGAELDEKPCHVREKDIHFFYLVEKVCQMDGWKVALTPDDFKHENLALLQELLRIGIGRQLKPEERQKACTQIVAATRQLWQAPILWPNDPQGSYIRQISLQLAIQSLRFLAGPLIFLPHVD